MGKHLPGYFSPLFEHIRDAVIGLDRDFRIEYYNPSAGRLFGWKGEEAIGQSVVELLDRSLTGQQIEQIRARLDAEGSLPIADTVRLRQGRELCLQGTVLVARDPLGKHLGYAITLQDHTEQSKLFGALAGEKARLKAIVDQTPAGIVVTNPDGDIILVNKLANALFSGAVTGNAYRPSGRYSLHHLDGSPFSPEDLPLPIALREKRPTQPMAILVKSEGQQDRIIYSKASPFFDELGSLLGAVVVLEDITDQVHAEQKLQENETRLELALEAANMIAWEWDVRKNEMRVTGNFSQLYGIPVPRRGEDAVRLVCSEDRADHIRAIKQVLRGAAGYHQEFRVVRQDNGEIAWLEEWCVSVQSEGGEVQKLIGVAKDVTERKQNQQMLENSLRAQEEIAERFRASVECLLDGYAILSAVRENGAIVDFRYEYINEAGCQLNRRNYAEHVGHTLLELLPGHKDSGLMDRYVKLVDNGEPVFIENDEYEDIFGGKRMQRTFEVRAVRLGDGFVLTWRDISERKAQEARVKRYAERLRQSNRDLEQFAFIASHDLQEPLRKIKLFGNSLSRSVEGQLPEEAADSLVRMQKAAVRMEKMIQGLLELSRVNTRGGNFERINLTHLAQDVASDLESSLLASGGQVTIDPLPVIEGDPVQIQQLLQNLISNALKFHHPDLPPEVRISGEVSQGLPDSAPVLVLKVQDNGIGFDMDNFDRILQPFQRLNGRSEYEGTGIGLAICKQIVERHHGRITAQSQPGEGATFFIILPLQQ